MTFGRVKALVAGATGYLGSRVVRAFKLRGARVRALVRPGKHVDEADENLEAEVTEPDTVRGVCDGMEWVASALGITRQRDNVTYNDVDYGGNLALLKEAELAGVNRFGVISVVDAERFRGNPMVDAKLKFLEALEKSTVSGRVVAATGFFSDMGELLDMARRGTVYLFGDGRTRINPVDGNDVAQAFVDVMAGDADYAEVGGPEVLSWNQIAELAFQAVDKPARCRHVPPGLVRVALPVATLFARKAAAGTDFLLRVTHSDLVAPQVGTSRLGSHFEALAQGSVE